MKQRRKGYYKGKYNKEWHVVVAFLLTVAVVMVMNGVSGG